MFSRKKGGGEKFTGQNVCLAQSYPVKWVSGKNLGKSCQRNFRMARKEIFIDRVIKCSFENLQNLCSYHHYLFFSDSV